MCSFVCLLHFVQAGGPYYPVLTGRRDSDESYYDEAMANIPKPIDDINRTLELFSVRGFNEREIVSLLGTKLKYLLNKVENSFFH